MSVADPTFTVNGTVAKLGAVVITWTPDGGFDDPTGNTALLIQLGEQVCGTATGPCYPAAASPAVVAYLTAVHAVDEVTSVDVDPTLQAQLDELSAVPDGATA